jgi:curli biogenesis system outer membrane secretion channel CsgG
VAVLVAAPAFAQARPRIAVLSMENATTNRIFGDQLGGAASDELTTQLVKADAFSVIERSRIDAVLEEIRAGQSGAINAATAARAGQILGVQYVLLGSITQFSIDEKSGGIGRLSASYAEAESKIDVRVVSTTTAEIVSVAEGGGKKRLGGVAYKDIRLDRDFNAGIAQEALRPAVENAVRQLVDAAGELAAAAPAAPLAQVVGANEGAFYIDSGEDGGVQVGQKYDVVRVIDTIRDASGTVLDEVTENVGVLEVTRVLSQSAIAKLVEGEAQEGDRVRPRG